MNNFTRLKTFIYIFLLLANIMFAQKYTNLKNIQRKDKKGNVCAIYNIDSPQYLGEPNEVAEKFLKDNKNIWGFYSDLKDLKFICAKENNRTNHVLFKQIYNGMEIAGSEIVVSINNQNSVTMVVCGYQPNLKIKTVPKITSAYAENVLP